MMAAGGMGRMMDGGAEQLVALFMFVPSALMNFGLGLLFLYLLRNKLRAWGVREA
jgi:hypothetical protein